MHAEKHTKRGQGNHLERNEVKKEIIRYILQYNDPVLEPELREHLNKKFSICDVTNIKKHLQDLQKKPYFCIKKTQHSGYPNKWNIDSVERLRNIRKEFREIELTIYEKVLNITLAQFMDLKNTPLEEKFKDHLKMSKTFFDMCILTDIKTLYERWLDLLLLTDDGDAYYKMVKNGEITRKELLDDPFIKALLPYIAFKHCIYQDILMGVASPQAVEFIENISKNYNEIPDSALNETVEMVLKNYSEKDNINQ